MHLYLKNISNLLNYHQRWSKAFDFDIADKAYIVFFLPTVSIVLF